MLNITMCHKKEQKKRNIVYCKLDAKVGTRFQVSMKKSGILQFYF